MEQNFDGFALDCTNSRNWNYHSLVRSHLAVLVVNYGISNTAVLETP